MTRNMLKAMTGKKIKAKGIVSKRKERGARKRRGIMIVPVAIMIQVAATTIVVSIGGSAENIAVAGRRRKRNKADEGAMNLVRRNHIPRMNPQFLRDPIPERGIGVTKRKDIIARVVRKKGNPLLVEKMMEIARTIRVTT